MSTLTSADGLRLLSQGDIEGAHGVFASLLASSSDLAQAFYGLGVVALTQRNHELARQHFRNCLSQDPTHTNALFQLGFIEKQTGNVPGAIHFWQQSLQANPNNGSARRELAALGALPSSPPPIQPSTHPTAPQPDPPPGPTPDVQPSDVARPVVGYDVYGLLKRSDSGVEREITRLLDEVAAMMLSRSQRVRAFIGSFLVLWLFAIGGTFVLTLAGRRNVPEELALGVIGFALFITVARVLSIKCNKIHCDRYVFTQKTGVLATHKRNDHLWLMSRDEPMHVERSLLNRLTDDGALVLGKRRYTGFFSGAQLDVIQKNFAQVRLLMPTNREVLAALGQLTQIRSQEK